MTISAVLPVFNSQHTLKRAINSLLIQPEIDQIILVEDGSEDESLLICEYFANSSDRIQLLRHPRGENLGAPASRNLGLSQVKNSWVQFMDADDALLPGKISDQVSCIKGGEAIVVGKFSIFSEGKSRDVNPIKDVWSGLMTTRLGVSASNLWNVDHIRKVGGWNESLPNMQEYYLMFEILKQDGKVVFSENKLTNIFSQPDSITNSSFRFDDKRNNYFLFWQKVKDHLISLGEYNIRRKHHFEVCNGRMLRYHQPPFPVTSSKIYFSLYRRLKNLLPHNQ